MAGRFPRAWLDELRARVDIVSVIGARVPLKQRGRRYWACCPFHGETKPSFSITPDTQTFYCFGCKKGGSVIDFVMEYERCDFLDAVKELADQAHMQLPDKDMSHEDDGASRALRERIWEANRAAARYYHDLLWTPEGAEALTYLYKRGLDDSGIKRFGLGVSPRHGGLTEHLMEMGFEEEVLIRAWLTGKKDGRLYDMFRNRAMFPIIDGSGRVLGFGGRIMGDGEPKYLNTSDTPVFNKRRNVYAMNFLRKERNLQAVILVEGYMDVVSLRNRGVPGAVATLGTALTDEQAALLRRFAPEVRVCYDGDSAGQKAILRALDIFEEAATPVRVLDIPGNMDPDDYVRANGAEGFMKLRPMAPAEYRLIREAEKHDLSTEDGRMQFALAGCEIVRRVRTPVEQDRWIRYLSERSGVDARVLARQVGAAPPPGAETARQRATSQTARKAEAFQPAEGQLIRLCASGQVSAELLDEELFVSPLALRIVEGLKRGETPSAIVDAQSEEDRAEAARAFVSPLDEGPVEAELAFEQCVGVLRRQRMDAQINELMEALHQETDPVKKNAQMDMLRQLTLERARI